MLRVRGFVCGPVGRPCRRCHVTPIAVAAARGARLFVPKGSGNPILDLRARETQIPQIAIAEAAKIFPVASAFPPSAQRSDNSPDQEPGQDVEAAPGRPRRRLPDPAIDGRNGRRRCLGAIDRFALPMQGARKGTPLKRGEDQIQRRREGSGLAAGGWKRCPPAEGP